MIVGVFTGEGIGPEVVPAAIGVLEALARKTSQEVEIRYGGAIGRKALVDSGKSLTDEAVDFCESVFSADGAIFCGPGSARFVYEVRAHFDLFCKFTPLRPMRELLDCSIVKFDPDANIDIIAVRENVGGVYFGAETLSKTENDLERVNVNFEYTSDRVMRILQVAQRLAEQRRGQLCLVVKRDGVPLMSQLWCEQMERLKERSSVHWRLLDIDNAVYQLVANPASFDVIVSPNMFGDILGDCGSLLLGSRGVSFSGNFSDDGRCVFQTAHGAAYDIAGKDVANPIGQILSMAMMLEEGFGWAEGADLVRRAVARTLSSGLRTRDIRGEAQVIVGCKQMALEISKNLELI